MKFTTSALNWLWIVIADIDINNMLEERLRRLIKLFVFHYYDEQFEHTISEQYIGVLPVESFDWLTTEKQLDESDPNG